jgi:hypothetical protein
MRSFLEMGVWFGGQTVCTVGDRFKSCMLNHIVFFKFETIRYDLKSGCMSIYGSMGRALRACEVAGKKP